MVANSSFTYFEKTAEMLRALAHPLRLAIIMLLFQKKEMIVSDIYEKLEIEQATTSHHLKILRFNGIVECRKEGRFIYYYLRKEQLPNIIPIINGLKLHSAQVQNQSTNY